MAKFPALPLWTDAWVADTKHLTICERGLYHDLLVLMWRSPGCRVPNDPEWLTKRLNAPPNEIKPIIEEFCVNDGNWLTQKRLMREYNYVTKKSQVQSVRAKIRWEKEKNNARAYATGCIAPTPTPTPIEERKIKYDADASVGNGLPKNETFDKTEVPVNETSNARLWREGKPLLIAMGVSEKHSGSIIGRWLRDRGDPDGILAALNYAYGHGVIEPVAYVSKLLNGGGNGRGGSFEQRCQELADKAREIERASGIGRPPDSFRSH
jgi:uncharacterized protein YdaU (DUF1376 family)